MNDPDRYSIMVRRVTIDGDDCFTATVRELPDVAEFADTREEAYTLALETVAELQKSAAENGKPFPDPIVDSEEDFSGRVTLRMPPSLHRSLSALADAEKASLNQYIVLLLAGAATANGRTTLPWEQTAISHRVHASHFLADRLVSIKTHGVIKPNAWENFFIGSAKTRAKQPSRLNEYAHEMLSISAEVLDQLRKMDTKEVAVTESSSVDLLSLPANIPLVPKPTQRKTHVRK